ncbi:hypothetical protein HC928_21435 [bacterium]|nr:hypothetical protein [bacterium]
MGRIKTSSVVALGLVSWTGFTFNANALMLTDMAQSSTVLEERASGLSRSTVVDLDDLTTNPSNYDFFYL